MDTGLAGRTVLVTGASGGIGQEIARAFAAEKANVVVHFNRNQEQAENLIDELGEPATLAIQADLTNKDSINSMFDRIAERFSGVDHLVCNAGVWPPGFVPVAEMTIDQWKETIDVDLTSVFLSCRRFLQQVKHSALVDPSIVLIGSTAGVFGEAGHADYASAKSGMIGGLMNTLKNEIVTLAGQGRVNAVSPGWVLTPMTEKFANDQSALEQALSTIAMKKVAAPQDIANAVVFLSSPRVAGHISGQNLVVSGGMEGRLLHP